MRRQQAMPLHSPSLAEGYLMTLAAPAYEWRETTRRQDFARRSCPSSHHRGAGRLRLQGATRPLTRERYCCAPYNRLISNVAHALRARRRFVHNQLTAALRARQALPDEVCGVGLDIVALELSALAVRGGAGVFDQPFRFLQRSALLVSGQSRAARLRSRRRAPTVAGCIDTGPHPCSITSR